MKIFNTHFNKQDHIDDFQYLQMTSDIVSNLE